MSNHSHHHRRHKKKGTIGEFFDRLFGRRRHKTHRSHFPGIHLPDENGNRPGSNREKEIHAAHPEIPVTPDATNESGTPEQIPPQPVYPRYEHRSSSSSRRKRSFREAFEIYLKKRSLRREERMRDRMKRKHRQKAQDDYRRMNRGPGLGSKLFSTLVEGEEAEKEKKVPLFSQRNPMYRNITIATNSTVIFLATYAAVYLFYWLTCMMVASLYGLDSTLYFYDLKFNDHSPLWSRFNILLVTGIPPFFCLFLAAFLMQVVFKIKKFVGLQKLFILWTSFHLFTHFFGAFPAGIITDEGFGYVAAWLYMNTAFKFLFSLIFLFLLGLIGFYSAKHILETSDSLHRIKPANRLSFMFFQMAIPLLLGTVILLLLRIPKNFDYPYETLMLLTMAFLVIPPFFNEKVKPELNLLKVKKTRNINIGYLSMMLALVLFLRIMLGIGLHFIIEIRISISPAVG